MWPDTVNKVFYQYGREYPNNTARAFGSLWSYDTIYNTWNQSAGPDAQSAISWPAFGAGATTDQGIGYYYGGYLSAKTISPWNGDPVMLKDMVSYNMTERTWSKRSYQATPRAEGTLQYITAGERGMLVYFGGVEMVNGKKTYVCFAKPFKRIPMN